MRVGDINKGETFTGAPIVVKDRVLVGNSGAELGVRGYVAALDLHTGKELWRAFNTGPDADVKIGAGFHAFYAKDQGKDLGVTSWPSEQWKLGGSTVWGGSRTTRTRISSSTALRTRACGIRTATRRQQMVLDDLCARRGHR